MLITLSRLRNQITITKTVVPVEHSITEFRFAWAFAIKDTPIPNTNWSNIIENISLTKFQRNTETIRFQFKNNHTHKIKNIK